MTQFLSTHYPLSHGGSFETTCQLSTLFEKVIE